VNADITLALFVVVLGASGVFLMLPHKHGLAKPRTAHAVGGVLAGVALLLFALYWAPPVPAGASRFFFVTSFYVCAAAAIACGAMMVTVRDPIHCALWFAAVVLSTSGLFLLAGASFLAAGTVIVYAGAIIVTFLFVIMLAQMEGKAVYDRAARMPFRATWTCFVLFLGVLWSIFSIPPPDGPPGAPPSAIDRRLPRLDQLSAGRNFRTNDDVRSVSFRAVRASARLADDSGRPKPHVAGLGETLYSDHLVTVELAGGLLFVALVGALAIAAPRPPARRNEPRGNGAVAAPTSANV
jgi:NADH-quinone oxidoreductase subunit J